MTVSRLTLIPAVLACVFPVMAVAQSNDGAALPISTPSAQPGQGPPAQTGIDDPDFKAATQVNIPLTPAMVRELGRRLRENQAAGEEVVAPPVALPITRSVNATTGPGGAVSIIQAVQGYPTALAFVDSTGQPWPIAWDSNSNPASERGGAGAAVQAVGFDVHVPVKGSNVLQIAPAAFS